MLQWIKKAWDLVTPEILRKSFKKGGISNAMDRTEDDLFNLEEEEEESFEGFPAAEVEDAEELNVNMQAGLTVQNTQDIELYPESDVDSEYQDDYDFDAGSPGN